MWGDRGLRAVEGEGDGNCYSAPKYILKRETECRYLHSPVEGNQASGPKLSFCYRSP